MQRLGHGCVALVEQRAGLPYRGTQLLGSGEQVAAALQFGLFSGAGLELAQVLEAETDELLLLAVAGQGLAAATQLVAKRHVAAEERPVISQQFAVGGHGVDEPELKRFVGEQRVIVLRMYIDKMRGDFGQTGQCGWGIVDEGACAASGGQFAAQYHGQRAVGLLPGFRIGVGGKELSEGRGC